MSKKNTKIDYSRQKDLFNPILFPEGVSIIGLGTIGSNVAYCLARLGIHRLSIWDHDIVNFVNLPSQAYSYSDVGKSKTLSLAKSLKNFLKTIILYNNIKPKTKFTSKVDVHFIDPIIVIAVDSMKEREKLCKILIKKQKKSNKRFVIIDGRIGGSQIEIYTRTNLEKWKKTFSKYPDQDPCGARNISYIGTIIAGLISNQVKRILKHEGIKLDILFNIDSLQLL